MGDPQQGIDGPLAASRAVAQHVLEPGGQWRAPFLWWGCQGPAGLSTGTAGDRKDNGSLRAEVQTDLGPRQ